MTIWFVESVRSLPWIVIEMKDQKGNLVAVSIPLHTSKLEYRIDN